MWLFIALFGVLIGALGAFGLIHPEGLLRFARLWQTTAGLYVAAAIRICLGVLLFLAAADSRLPSTLLILGIVILVSGLVTPCLGIERFGRILEWWAARSSAFKRVWSGCALAFGVLLLYAVIP